MCTAFRGSAGARPFSRPGPVLPDWEHDERAAVRGGAPSAPVRTGLAITACSAAGAFQAASQRTTRQWTPKRATRRRPNPSAGQQTGSGRTIPPALAPNRHHYPPRRTHHPRSETHPGSRWRTDGQEVVAAPTTPAGSPRLVSPRAHRFYLSLGTRHPGSIPSDPAPTSPPDPRTVPTRPRPAHALPTPRPTHASPCHRTSARRPYVASDVPALLGGAAVGGGVRGPGR